MPGKVNPVIPEAVTMVASQVIGYDITISVAVLNGNLDLNVMRPIIAYELLQSVALAANATRILAEKCVAGITADGARCQEYAEKSAALVTTVAPAIGYDNAARLFKKALAEDKAIRQVMREEAILAEERIDEILDLKKLTTGGRIDRT